MIQINIPNNNINERKYIIDIILGDFLGLQYSILIKDISYYEIILDNNHKLIIEDYFFNYFKNNLEYLSIGNIPKKIFFGENQFTKEKNIPIIFGNDLLNITSNQIKCGIDLFASSFFMLTRWEEYVNKNRDSHNRFISKDSLALKNNFLQRPVVNEYTEMLWNMLKYLDIQKEKKEYFFNIKLTHDVDNIILWNKNSVIIKMILGDLIKRKDLKSAIKNLKEFLLFKINKGKDPFDTFDWIMDQSEKNFIKSNFYFMSGGDSIYDNKYSINENISKDLINKIKSRGHNIGIHPSYNAYNNSKKLKEEKERISKITSLKIEEGRNHYLRFEIPTTWQIWEENDLKIDSTCGYSDKNGFRCGVCYKYNVFNILTRERLNLQEHPLIVMEASFVYSKVNSSTEMEKEIIYLLKKTKDYNGQFVLLWHNSSFNTKYWEKFKNVYIKTIGNHL